jgi:hypothetical protein
MEGIPFWWRWINESVSNCKTGIADLDSLAWASYASPELGATNFPPAQAQRVQRVPALQLLMNALIVQMPG